MYNFHYCAGQFTENDSFFTYSELTSKPGKKGNYNYLSVQLIKSKLRFNKERNLNQVQ